MEKQQIKQTIKQKEFNAVKSIIDFLDFTGGLLFLAMKPGRINSYSRQREIGNYLEEKMFGAGKISIDSKDERKKFKNRFYYLRKRGLVDVEYRGNQIYISLTKEGKRKAGRYKIDDLKIETAKKWDKNWRVLIFDIEDRHKAKREALRGKIKQLGLFQLQKSVWVCPYEFKKEMDVLRGFFGLESNEMKVIIASEIENDKPIRDFFGLE